MEQYGNEHYNVERVLRENINGHEYMRRTAREMSTWDEVVEEIYRTVDHVEPWMSGNVRGPSTAFCLLYRLFEIKLTEDQVVETITCKDSPYIRAVRTCKPHVCRAPMTRQYSSKKLRMVMQVGFLYLRYVGDPKDLESWFEPYFEDSQVREPEQSVVRYGQALPPTRACAVQYCALTITWVVWKAHHPLCSVHSAALAPEASHLHGLVTHN